MANFWQNTANTLGNLALSVFDRDRNGRIGLSDAIVAATGDNPIEAAIEDAGRIAADAVRDSSRPAGSVSDPLSGSRGPVAAGPAQTPPGFPGGGPPGFPGGGPTAAGPTAGTPTVGAQTAQKWTRPGWLGGGGGTPGVPATTGGGGSSVVSQLIQHVTPVLLAQLAQYIASGASDDEETERAVEVLTDSRVAWRALAASGVLPFDERDLDKLSRKCHHTYEHTLNKSEKEALYAVENGFLPESSSAAVKRHYDLIMVYLLRAVTGACERHACGYYEVMREMALLRN